MTMIKPRIITELLRKDDKLSKIIIKDTAKPIGRSSYIALPKELVGKYITVTIEVHNE